VAATWVLAWREGEGQTNVPGPSFSERMLAHRPNRRNHGRAIGRAVRPVLMDTDHPLWTMSTKVDCVLSYLNVRCAHESAS
jgi:hypothetical protein